jgi:tRNA A-37 threonylcarbamoyl transferase component Bud32
MPDPPPQLRLRAVSPELLALPWDLPLPEWDATEVPLRDIPVGPSRHLVRFVEADGQLWALKQLPVRVAEKEYDVLARMRGMGLPAVRPAGLVVRTPEDAVLVTHYLADSWQYRRLFLRIPPNRAKHRARLLDALASLLVELHRHGVFWGDCSLANTLFSRDGQTLQAWFVDAETSEIHSRLSDGQRGYDLDIMVENVAGGMLDMAARLGDPPELSEERLIAEAREVARRYTALWDVLHAEPTFSFADRYRVEGRIRALHELGFAVEEVALAPVADHADGSEVAVSDRLRLRVAVGDRRFHAAQLHTLTGLETGEGQAAILLGDLHAYHAQLRRTGEELTEQEAATRWLDRVVRPGMRRAHEALHGLGSPVQAYCDLLEVRWILSERAGHDVGDTVALEALARGGPRDSAARLALAEPSTGQLPRLDAALLAELDSAATDPL